MGMELVNRGVDLRIVLRRVRSAEAPESGGVHAQMVGGFRSLGSSRYLAGCRRWGIMVAAAVGYALAARLGLLLFELTDYVSVVWPASGVAIAAGLVLGPRAGIPVALGSSFFPSRTTRRSGWKKDPQVTRRHQKRASSWSRMKKACVALASAS